MDGLGLEPDDFGVAGVECDLPTERYFIRSFFHERCFPVSVFFSFLSRTGGG